ncbi:unnamed protein product [Rotaria sp. Silwood2]|nr:unnamed protein product [Rotaria sp. Silwood2]CAF4425229.1 unnamed protein product [Rotaria sp. Silwood2]
MIKSNSIIQTRISQVAYEFVRVRDEFLNNEIPDIAADTDRYQLFLDRFRMIDIELINTRMNSQHVAIAVCGPNSSGKSAFIQYFLQIGKILPSAAGAISARIVKFTYASAEQACARIYNRKSQGNEEYDELIDELSLSSHFNTKSPWKNIEEALKKHLERPSDIAVTSDEFIEWARKWIEIRIPSSILQVGIDIYDTPGFLSCNREEFLNQNLYSMIKKVCPTILFLYENPAITRTDADCFLELTKTVQSFDRSRIFFLNTKANIKNIFHDYGITTDENISFDKFNQILAQSRQLRYDLLRRQSAMGNESIGALPTNVYDCDCFDICSIPTSTRTPFRDYLQIMNDACFTRIIEFVFNSALEPMLDLARSIRSIIDDFFDFSMSANNQDLNYWDHLRDEAIKWSFSFIEALQGELPNLVESMHENILRRFDTLSPDIIQRASRLKSMTNNSNIVNDLSQIRMRDYLEQVVNEEVIKVVANETLNNATKAITTLNIFWNSPKSESRNEFINIARRTVMKEISVKQLGKKTLFTLLSENIKRTPTRLKRFARFVIMRPWANFYKSFEPSHLPNQEEAEFYIFDTIDNYSELLNESAREEFARKRLNIMRERLMQQRESLHVNLFNWITQKRQEFCDCIDRSYRYIIKTFNKRQRADSLSRQFLGRFAQIECQLLAAEDLAQFYGIQPILHEYIGQGGYFRIERAEWGNVQGLVVKRSSQTDLDDPYMPYLEAHYHRIVTELMPINAIVPLLYLYEHELNSSDETSTTYELWIFMPEFKQSLRDYLRANIINISFETLHEFAVEIVIILSEFHRLNIVYRDLKTSNILLDEYNHCHFTDFGTCYQGYTNRTFIGTAPFSPEILAQAQSSSMNTYNGEAVDIFSLGTILYELLPKKQYHRVSSEDVPHIRSVIEQHVCYDFDLREYKDLIVACLQVNPKDRPTSSQISERLHTIFQRYQSHKQATQCSVCCNRRRSVRFLPCNHKVLCQSCWQERKAKENLDKKCTVCEQCIEQSLDNDDCDDEIFIV